MTTKDRRYLATQMLDFMNMNGLRWDYKHRHAWHLFPVSQRTAHKITKADDMVGRSSLLAVCVFLGINYIIDGGVVVLTYEQHQVANG